MRGEYLKGLQTQSGKLEFECYEPQALQGPGAAADRQIRAVVGGPARGELFEKYPLQLLTPHSKYSFHTQGDGKDSFLLNIPDHRVNVGGYYYWIVRLNAADAAARGIKKHDLVKVYQRPRRGDLRGAADAAPAARRLPRLRILGHLRRRWASPAGRSSAAAASTSSRPSGRRPRSTHSLAGANSLVADRAVGRPDRARLGHLRRRAGERPSRRRVAAARAQRRDAMPAQMTMLTRGDRCGRMAKWNMIIDVAECTNCNNCTLATMDEYVGNAWPGYAAPMPKHGHRWINILQKERGQAPMIDIAYVPTLCNHCDDAPCIKAARDGAITKREDGIVLIDPVKAKGQKQLVEACPYGHIWWNEELQAAAGLAVRRASPRPGLAADARPAILPDRRDARGEARGRRDGAHGARGRARGDAARARHQAARLLPQSLALYDLLHRRHALGRGRRASSIASRARACGS